MKLKSIFQEYRIGDECIGAIMMYRLNSRKLKEAGIIRLRQGDKKSHDTWVFCGFENSRISMKSEEENSKFLGDEA